MSYQKKVYIGGDMLYKGSQLLREKEKEMIVSRTNCVPYAPQDDKEINDKSNQSENSNNGLAEKIVLKDSKAMTESDILIFDVQRFAEGTICEVGQMLGMRDLAEAIKLIIELGWSLKSIEEICDGILNKQIYCHCEDIRRTDIPEVGDRRSFYINQYVYGAVLKLTNGKGFMEMEDIIDSINERKV